MGQLVSIAASSTSIGTEPPATIRAPEIEPGVGCNFDSYLLVPDNTLDDRIAAAKNRLGEDVVILGHHYQRDEVIKFADFRCDSLKLYFQASEAYARYIVFCGVHFMAESADILRREPAGAMLRLSVEGGGCSGFQYKFDMERAKAADDLVISRDGAVVLIDPISVNYMAGSEIDFVDDLIGASFKVNNPKAKASCGCGTSFAL